VTIRVRKATAQAKAARFARLERRISMITSKDWIVPWTPSVLEVRAVTIGRNES
jgi:hypothetical protein